MQPPSRILLLAWLLASGLLVAAEPVRPTQMPGDERGNEGDVFIMDLADGSRRVINPNDLLQDDPVWSPNGKHVAYLLSETGDYADRRIWVMDNNGNDARKLSANGYVTKVHWCGDDTLFYGRYESVLQPTELWRINADGSREQKLIGAEQDLEAQDCVPGATRVLVTREHDQEIQLLIVDADGGTQSLATLSGSTLSPRLSPDGQRVSYVMNIGGQADIFILDLDSGLSRQVTNTNYAEDAPDWIDNHTLVFEAIVGDRDIWVVQTGID